MFFSLNCFVSMLCAKLIDAHASRVDDGFSIRTIEKTILHSVLQGYVSVVLSLHSTTYALFSVAGMSFFNPAISIVKLTCL